MEKCRLPEGAETNRLITLPLRLGGLGLRPHARSAHAAFLSSFILAAPTLLSTLAPGSAPDLQRALLMTGLWKDVTACWDWLLVEGVHIGHKLLRGVVPRRIEEFAEYSCW